MTLSSGSVFFARGYPGPVDCQQPDLGVLRVCFLPGATGEGRFWEPVAAALPREWEKRFVDWPGLGTVPASPTVATFEDLVDLVIDGLRGGDVIVAQSMGGAVAMQVALRSPGSVAALVLCATSAGFDMSRHGAVDWRPAFRAANPHAPDLMFDDVPEIAGQLAGLRVRTLLIWATEDPVSPLSVGRYLASALPNATLVTFESDDHWIARSRAPEVARSIVEHLTL